MNIAYALDYIPRRMREMGFGDRYTTRYRQVLVEDKVELVFKAHNQLLFFISPMDEGLKVESEKGVYDPTNTKVNEQQFEHTGEVKVRNDIGRPTHVIFIQVIPQHKKRKA